MNPAPILVALLILAAFLGVVKVVPFFDETIKKIIYIVACLFAILWVMHFIGYLPSFPFHSKK